MRGLSHNFRNVSEELASIFHGNTGGRPASLYFLQSPINLKGGAKWIHATISIRKWIVSLELDYSPIKFKQEFDKCLKEPISIH